MQEKATNEAKRRDLHLTDFPNEILVEILDRLSTVSIFRIRLASRSFNYIVSEHFDDIVGTLTKTEPIKLEDIPERIDAFSTRPIIMQARDDLYDFYNRTLTDRFPDTKYFNVILLNSSQSYQYRSNRERRISLNRKTRMLMRHEREAHIHSLHRYVCPLYYKNSDNKTEYSSLIDSIRECSVFNYSDIFKDGKLDCKVVTSRIDLKQYVMGTFLDKLYDENGYKYIAYDIVRDLKMKLSKIVSKIGININRKTDLSKVKFDYYIKYCNGYDDKYYRVNGKIEEIESNVKKVNACGFGYNIYIETELTTKIKCYYIRGEMSFESDERLSNQEEAFRLFGIHWGNPEDLKLNETSKIVSKDGFDWEANIIKLINSVGTARKGSNAYTSSELKVIARSLSTSTSGNKKMLIRSIFRAASILEERQYNPRPNIIKKLNRMSNQFSNKGIENRKLIRKLLDVWNSD